MTIFEKIIRREIPADILYEDADAIAFKDIVPQAPIHILVVPKIPRPSLAQITPDDKNLLGHLLWVAHHAAKLSGCSDSGYRVVINTNADGGQTVDHIHLHVLGGRAMNWPPG